MRDLNCDLCSLAGLKQVISEPVIQEGNDRDIKGLRVDWSLRGFWDSQKIALFDIVFPLKEKRLVETTPVISRLS